MKIPFDKMKLVLRPSVNSLHNLFIKHNFEIRIVGGAVRDLLMEKNPTDIDFATTATPTQMKSMFMAENIRTFGQKAGDKHGTIMARIEEDNFACSTLRNYKILNGKQEIKFIHDWKQDANRRDLTVNAMFLGLDGTLYDYFNGVQHLKERKVKFVDNAEDRIMEDPFRIIRYFRFFGMLTNDPHTHDSEAIESITKNRDLLKQVSTEKIILEFRKVLTGKYNHEILSKMIECGLNEYVGLPRDCNCENLAKIYKNINGTDYHYCLLLAAGMRNEEDVKSFTSNMKANNLEKNYLHFIIEYRSLFSNIQSLEDIKDLLVDVAYVRNRGRNLTTELCKQLLLYVGKKDLLKDVDNLIPYFPIKHGVIDKGFRKMNTKERQLLLKLWKESDYMLSKEELQEKL